MPLDLETRASGSSIQDIICSSRSNWNAIFLFHIWMKYHCNPEFCESDYHHPDCSRGKGKVKLSTFCDIWGLNCAVVLFYPLQHAFSPTLIDFELPSINRAISIRGGVVISTSLTLLSRTALQKVCARIEVGWRIKPKINNVFHRELHHLFP